MSYIRAVSESTNRIIFLRLLLRNDAFEIGDFFFPDEGNVICHSKFYHEKRIQKIATHPFYFGIITAMPKLWKTNLTET